MKQVECCTQCGSRLIQYNHSMSLSLATILEQFTVDSKGRETELIKTKLTHTQIANFQKLRYWDLVNKGTKKNTWVLTMRGLQFLNGLISISQTVTTFRGKRTAYSREVVFFHELTGHSYATREDYAKSAMPVRSNNPEYSENQMKIEDILFDGKDKALTV